jgi:ADP-heptose:LPS heptosyltransferase
MRSRENSRILLIVRGHIGDLIQATPALRELRRHLPDAHIAVLVNEFARDVLNGSPYVDEVIVGFAYRERTRRERVADLFRLVRTLAGRFDTVVALRNAPASWPALALAIRARTRVGFDRPPPLGWLVTHKATRAPRGSSNRLRNLAALGPLGVEGAPAYEPLPADPSVRTSVNEVLASVGVTPGADPYAVLQVSCDWGCNELRSDKWAAIVDGLATTKRLASVIVGLDEPTQQAKVAEIVARAEHPPISLLGRTTLPELFEVVRQASLVVATDSALTQVALAEQVPAVVMFGIEPVDPNGPLPAERERMEVVQHWEGPDLAPTPNSHCRFNSSSCHWEHCRENSSLARTEPEEVLVRAGATLGRRASAAPEAG